MSSSDVRRSRLEAVARSFVRDKVQRACVIVVASADDAGLVGPVASELARTARGFGLFCARLDSVEDELASVADGPELWIVETGGVDESWLHRLDPPSGKGPDLLIWVSSDQRDQPLREAYLLGMLSWSVQAIKTVALVTASDDELRDACASIPGAAVETVRWKAGKSGHVLAQILQSVLSAGARRHSLRSRAQRAQLG